ncbi:MAG: tetratricopeptide repeat protein [Deltaproteobacteria bacterium]|nr:tetratricopeptide repeat protein [Deltaproteobacteria bacterium]
MRHAILLCVAMLGLAASAPSAWADKKADAAARKHFEDGTTAYDLGDFETAIREYKAAYQARKEPVFLYNIAQAYRLQGNFQQASFFYKSYLRNQPEAKNRAEVEARLADLEEQLEKQRKTSNAPPIGPVNPPSRGGGTGPTEPDADADGDVDADGDAAGDGGATRIPPPDQAAALGDDGASTTTAAATHDSGGKRPIYKKWWFWGGIGAVAVGAVVIIAVASGGDAGAPDSPLGDYRLP